MKLLSSPVFPKIHGKMSAEVGLFALDLRNWLALTKEAMSRYRMGWSNG